MKSMERLSLDTQVKHMTTLLNLLSSYHWVSTPKIGALAVSIRRVYSRSWAIRPVIFVTRTSRWQKMRYWWETERWIFTYQRTSWPIPTTPMISPLQRAPEWLLWTVTSEGWRELELVNFLWSCKKQKPRSWPTLGFDELWRLGGSRCVLPPVGMAC